MTYAELARPPAPKHQFLFRCVHAFPALAGRVRPLEVESVMGITGYVAVSEGRRTPGQLLLGGRMFGSLHDLIRALEKRKLDANARA
ncbi:MAG: hypothetical protein A3F84_10380 [Candidatus Handelsmanbacteria bacterium RIFCSPLOWO2_12_FULL_64_10]|uniref:Uncharacterized protein n=1 Tax=Handelsmanbacteria sp. (strain RIFCSPLOWO2_12_FULL_64_10) TaxID=1817868 RepID=A0A1F6CB38_HANXR|nr:MAG: hypothetical protein A3F84_10380 [Candidatus Handelsmanbacteria bacterium RIFCSPLOWO2_12_FULL_64_10]